MKFSLALLLAALCLGCKTQSLTPQNEKVVKAAIAKSEPPALLMNAAEVRHEPEMPTQPITINTRYAAPCPYCTKVSVSKSCLMSGGTQTNQDWTIYFECPCCHMSFSDYRTQAIPDVRSVRLPIVGE